MLNITSIYNFRAVLHLLTGQQFLIIIRNFITPLLLLQQSVVVTVHCNLNLKWRFLRKILVEEKEEATVANSSWTQFVAAAKPLKTH